MKETTPAAMPPCFDRWCQKDAGYENNTTFFQELENRELEYIGGLAKNRKIKVIN